MREPTLVVIFLRGGADGLNLIAPTADPDYIAARPEALRVLRTGDAPGIVLSHQAADADFRFHPEARPLADLFEAGELAVIHAAGLTDGTRSHFDAEERMERATPGTTASGGWIGRWLAEAQPEGALPALAVGDTLPGSLRGWSRVAVAGRLNDLVLAEGNDFAPLLASRLRAGFGRHPLLGPPVERLTALSDMLRARIGTPEGLRDYVPAVPYPDNATLAPALGKVAQAIKLDLGLRVATVDFGGWDTHDEQAGDFARLTGQLAQSLMAFWRDLGERRSDVTVVVMSEFGRRLRANRNNGTDHGHGNAMLVLGGAVRGGRMLGTWPGLANEALDDGADLAITTDYRHVLAEVMQRHMKAEAARLFPGFAPAPVGIFG
ncbi:MAG: DUF1501 domain-containing protein [Rhodobacteraceae bacterium]|nr:DUF1501 domain-containing protein [Paracoccaceae bacterium]